MVDVVKCLSEMSAARPRQFSAAVEHALAEVCPSSDPIDDPNFDVIDYLNKRFPDEASLQKIPGFYEETSKRLQLTEAELLRSVQTQATCASDATHDLKNAQSAVAKLYNRVTEIKNKAAESEAMVSDLSRNIRSLDTAKSNITTSINTLRSIQLWMMQLQTLAAAFNRTEKNFSQCRDALRECHRYSKMFENYKDIAKVKELNAKLATLSSQIEFFIRNNVISDVQTTGDLSGMAEACAVVDTMGEEAIRKIRERFIEKEMDIYGFLFKRGGEEAKLRRIERRYVWIRQRLDEKAIIFQEVFPKHWCVPQELCVSFCLKTRGDLEYELTASAGNIEIPVLTAALQRTIDIEKFLTTSMSHTKTSNYQFNGMILGCFAAHMGLFVSNEDELMARAVSQPFTEDQWHDDPNLLRVGMILPTADDIFVFIKESLRRTVKVNQQQILIDMAGVWRKHLVRYSQQCAALLPSPPTTAAHFRRVCMVINTADYCLTTSMGLGEEVATRSDKTVEEVNFEAVSEAFSALYSGAILQIVSGLEKQLAPAMQDFTSGQFAQAAAGGPAGAEGEAQDESAYVSLMRRCVQDVILNCAQVLPQQFLRFLLDKIAAVTVPKYTQSLYRLKRLSDISISQLRLDCIALEKVFLQLPLHGNAERFPQNMLTNYVKLVRREFDRMNRALKFMQTSPEVGAAIVDVYYEVTLPEDRSVSNFTRLIELKGIRREDCRAWISNLTKKGVPESTKRDQLRIDPSPSASGSGAAASPLAVFAATRRNEPSAGGLVAVSSQGTDAADEDDSKMNKFKNIVTSLTFLNRANKPNAGGAAPK